MMKTLFGHGILIVNEFGNGFVNLDNDNSQNKGKITVYIPKDKLARAYNLEEVDIEYCSSSSESNDLYSGKVINYTLKNKEFVGMVHHIYKDEIFVYTTELKNANLIRIKTLIYLDKNTWIEVKITDDSKEIYGELIQVLPNSINDIIAAKYKLTQLDEIDSNISTSSSITNSRLNSDPKYEIIDQTLLETFTIDPSESLDCDDAFSIELFEDIAKIYVHISNVACFFNPKHPLWEIICNRGNTFYGVNGKNWSMLPPNYANEICSILPNKETQVLTCEFDFSLADAKLEFIKYYPSKVISKNKYDYDTFDKLLLETNQPKSKEYILLEAARIIRNGYNDFIFSQETPAHWIVRYWMLHINTIMCRNIYRYNAIPDDNKQKILSRYIHTKYANKYISTLDTINLSRDKLVEICNENQSNDSIISYLGKTAMLKSFYTTDSELNYHYGIGKYGYTHWTSPIRRLPDLLNHCLLLGYSISESQLEEYIKKSNLAELKQDQLEKFIIIWKNAEKYKIGDKVNGIIIGIMKTGISVYVMELANKYTIHISKLSNSRLEYNDVMLHNDTIGIKYQLFDSIHLRISKLFFDIIEFDIEFNKV